MLLVESYRNTLFHTAPSQPDQMMQIIRAYNPNLPTRGCRFFKAVDNPTAESGVEPGKCPVERKQASLALVNRLAEERPDFVLIQEPRVNGGRICGLRVLGYNLYIASCVGKARTRILASKNFNVFYYTAIVIKISQQ